MLLRLHLNLDGLVKEIMKLIRKLRRRQQLHIHLKWFLLQFGFDFGNGINGSYWHLIPSFIIRMPELPNIFSSYFIQIEISFFCLQVYFGVYFGKKAAENKIWIHTCWRTWNPNKF